MNAQARLTALGLLLCAGPILAAILAVSPVMAQQPGGQTFETDELVIEGVGGRHGFTVELARTQAQRAQGLMFRKQMAPDAGMLFVYPRRRAIAMWMKNTYIPLDMLFIDRDGTIVHIAEWTTPHSLEMVGSGGRVLGVLELNGGTAARLGIGVGDRIVHSAFR